MRHPTNGLSEDDLSRLTGSSSSASCDNNSLVSSNSSSSSSSDSSPADSLVANKKKSAHVENFKSTSLDIIKSPGKKSLKNSINTQNTPTATNKTSSCFNSTYLPEIINPLEWQKSRKRKDRLDSTSSAILDRKLQRSNSEELIPPQSAENSTTSTPTGGGETSEQDDKTCSEIKANSGGQALNTSKTDVIQRISSEDFQRSQTPINTKSSDSQQNSEEQINENDSSWSNRQQQQQSSSQQSEKPFSLECWIGSYSCPTKDMTRRARYETSPARSQRLSPIRNNNQNGNKHRDSDDSECEHERRRNSERFCKSRAPPGRKASGVTKKSSSKYFPGKLNDENAYKYDLSTLKYERRGFISKKVIQGEKSSNSTTPTSDHNDNNLIDFHEQQKQEQQEQRQNSMTTNDSAIGDDEKLAVNSSSNSTNSTPTSPASSNHSILKQKPRAYSVPPITSAQDALPWGRNVPEDQAPVLSRRYATVRHHPGDNIDTAAKLSKVSPYPQQFHKQNTASQQLVDDLYDSLEPLNIYKGFSSLTSLRTSEVMTQVLPVMKTYQSPEERLNHVNKRMSTLKKKLSQLEEAYEARLGFRLSHAERLNDKQMKNILAEMSKLRKERHDLKSDPIGAMGLRVSGGDANKKLEKMKITLLEIEENLATKRTEANRSETLEDLNADQLVQEKSAVQHGLLYFESLYGRPSTKDERDAARPLYDRYRLLKRMVSRSVLISGNSNAGIPELPTILENEAMVFESTPPQQYSANNSSGTNSPSETLPPNSTNSTSDDSTTTTTTTTNIAAPNRASVAAVNAPEKLSGDVADDSSYKETSPPPVRKASTSENIGLMSIEQLWEHLEKTSEEKKLLKRSIREFETLFEEKNGRKMLKSDRRTIEETYAQYKEKKAKARLLEALIKKQIQR